MKEINFDVTLRTKDLFRFTMRHTYFSISGIFSLLISFGSLIACIATIGKYALSTTIVLLVIGLLFTVVQPCMLYMKCSVQVKKSENVNAALHYILSEEGITIQQDKQQAKVHWYEIRKRILTKQAVYLYMSPVRAFIFPQDQCNGQFHDVVAMTAELVEKYKDYEPEEEKTEDE